MLFTIIDNSRIPDNRVVSFDIQTFPSLNLQKKKMTTPPEFWILDEILLPTYLKNNLKNSRLSFAAESWLQGLQ